MTANADRKLWSDLRRLAGVSIRLRLAAAIAIAVIAGGLAGLAPLALQQLIDRGLDAPVSSSLMTGALYLGALLAGRLAGGLQVYLYARADQALQTQVSIDVFRTVLRLPLAFHLKSPPGSLVQLQAHALQGVRLLLSLACLSILPVIMQMTVILVVVAGIFDPGIWAIVAFAVAAYTFVFALGVRRTSSAAMRAVASQVDASRLFSDGVVNAESVKGFGAEDLYVQRYAGRLGAGDLHWRACFQRRAETTILATLVFGATMTAALGLGLCAVRDGQISIGAFVLLNAYLLQIVAPLEATGFAIRDASQAMAYLGGWRRFSHLEQEQMNASEMPQPEFRAPVIEFDDVSFAHEAGRPALENVSFKAEPGELTAIVGPSGAGKSTLLRLLQRHFQRDGGDIRIDGKPIGELDLADLRRRIAAVPQDVMLSNDSLRANLLIAKPRATDADLCNALGAAGLGALLGRLESGLDTEVGERGLALSGGERQRVGIARVLLRDADILVFDEATAALDASTEATVWSALMRAARGRTSLLVTHQLRLAARANRIIVLSHGRIVEQGSHDELVVAGGPYAQLWRAQSASERGRSRAPLGANP